MPKWFRFWPFLSIAALIFWLSVIKTPGLKFYDNWLWDNIDKIGHTIAYTALFFSGASSLRNFSGKKYLTFSSLKKLSVSCFLYGFMIEILQHFIPHRSFDPYDMISNVIGIILGSLVFARIYTKAFIS